MHQRCVISNAGKQYNYIRNQHFSTLNIGKPLDFTLALPDDVCVELGVRARARRVQMNVSVDEMAKRIGVSAQTLSNFERTGKCTLLTFVRILEALRASADLQPVLVLQVKSIDDMRVKAAARSRQRAYRRSIKPKATT